MRLTGIPLLPCHRRMEFLRIWDPKDCVYEILGRREENVKHFRLGDGSFVAVQYDAPVHYLDADGAWQGIDNRLAEDGSEYATSDARIKFAKKITGNETLFTLHDGNGKITMLLDDPRKKTQGVVTETETKPLAGTTQLQKMVNLARLSSRILYRDILEGADPEYVIVGGRIKENILVKESRELYSYTFRLKLNHFSASLADDGSVMIVRDDEESIYVIPAPVVYDADGVYASDGVAAYTLESDGKDYILTVHVDSAWMNAPERIFPITVDPTLGPESATVGTYIVRWMANRMRTAWICWSVHMAPQSGSHI